MIVFSVAQWFLTLFGFNVVGLSLLPLPILLLLFVGFA